jgi:hypothetical protein
MIKRRLRETTKLTSADRKQSRMAGDRSENNQRKISRSPFPLVEAEGIRSRERWSPFFSSARTETV